MSTQGQRPQPASKRFTQIARSLTPSLRSKNVVRGATALFVGTVAIGYLLVPAPAFADKAHLEIENATSNNVIFIKGSNFPSKATATVQTTVAGAHEENKVRVHGGEFKIAIIRGAAAKAAKPSDLVEAKAWTRGKSASAKRKLADVYRNSPIDLSAAAPTTTSTTAPPPPPTTEAPAPSTTAAAVTAPPKKATATTKAAPAPRASAAPAASGGVPAGYKLVWSDEFNGFDSSKWDKYVGAGNAGVGSRVASAVTAGNGELTITGQGTNGGGVGSSYRGTYGYYEVRQRFDAGSTGYNTATLLWPTSEHWPVDGEIDMVEIFNGATTNAGSYVHWGSGNSQLYNEYGGDFSQWHTWGVDWQADHLTYYLDGKPFWNVTNPAAIPHNPHFIGLQLDINSKGNQRSGSAFHVDYVRVYQK